MKLPPLPTAWVVTMAIAAGGQQRGSPLVATLSAVPAGLMTLVCGGSIAGSIASRRLGAPTPAADAARGALAALPRSPNCVGTADTAPDAALGQGPMAPLALPGGAAAGDPLSDAVAEALETAVKRGDRSARLETKRVRPDAL